MISITDIQDVPETPSESPVDARTGGEDWGDVRTLQGELQRALDPLIISWKDVPETVKALQTIVGKHMFKAYVKGYESGFLDGRKKNG